MHTLAFRPLPVCLLPNRNAKMSEGETEGLLEETTTEGATETAKKGSKLSRFRARYTTLKEQDNTFTVGLLAAITSFLTLLLLVALVVWNSIIIFTTDSATPFRTIFLATEGVFAAAMLSIYFDRPKYELFDFGTALLIFVVKLIPFLGIPLALEIMRVMSCPSGWGSTLYFTICNSYTNESSIPLWFFIAVSALSLVNFILLGAWFYQYSGRPKEAESPPGRTMSKAVRENLANSSSIGIGIIAVIVLVVIIFTMVVALFKANGDYAVWHYHGGFLILPATYAGMELAFFMTTPPSWAILCLIVGGLSLASLVLGLIKEIPRFFHCALGTGAPSTLDNDICANEGWRAFLLPSVMTLVTLLLLGSFIFMIVRVRNNAAAKKAKE